MSTIAKKKVKTIVIIKSFFCCPGFLAVADKKQLYAWKRWVNPSVECAFFISTHFQTPLATLKRDINYINRGLNLIIIVGNMLFLTRYYTVFGFVSILLKDTTHIKKEWKTDFQLLATYSVHGDICLEDWSCMFVYVLDLDSKSYQDSLNQLIHLDGYVVHNVLVLY